MQNMLKDVDTTLKHFLRAAKPAYYAKVEHGMG